MSTANLTAKPVFFFFTSSNLTSHIAVFLSDKFTDDYKVPFSHPMSESAFIMFQEVRSLPRVTDTTVAITNTLNTSFTDTKWRPWMSPADCDSAADDSVMLCHRRPGAEYVQKRVCLSCKSSKLTIILFCRHHGQQRTDGVVRGSCSSDIFLMWCKCWGWEGSGWNSGADTC